MCSGRTQAIDEMRRESQYAGWDDISRVSEAVSVISLEKPLGNPYCSAIGKPIYADTRLQLTGMDYDGNHNWNFGVERGLTITIRYASSMWSLYKHLWITHKRMWWDWEFSFLKAVWWSARTLATMVPPKLENRLVFSLWKIWFCGPLVNFCEVDLHQRFRHFPVLGFDILRLSMVSNEMGLMNS